MPQPPPDFSLGEEQLAVVSRCLRGSHVGLRNRKIDEYAREIERRGKEFLDAKQSHNLTPRAIHDSLRDLWHLAASKDPPIGLIRIHVQNLPDPAVRQLNYLAAREIPKYYTHKNWPDSRGTRTRSIPIEEADALSRDDFRKWAQIACGEALIWAIQTLPITGAVRVRGRRRGPGKRSADRVEPSINRVARGAGDEALLAGPPSDMPHKLTLIGGLAHAWERTTGAFPIAGRSDQTPFGDLVHSVFQWLGLDDGEAVYALRTFWKEVPQDRAEPPR